MTDHDAHLMRTMRQRLRSQRAHQLVVPPQPATDCRCAGCRAGNDCIGEGSSFWTDPPGTDRA